jgi:CheY-like chemotaxis protein
MKRKINYLIVEDDPASVLILKQVLKSFGFVVEYKHAEDKEQVEEFLLNNRFDLIISDHHMPSFTSLDVLETRNRLTPDIPFIILSMDMRICLKMKAYQLGCNLVVNKSEIDSLPWMIENQLKRETN